jgi:hypothetical protein
MDNNDDNSLNPYATDNEVAVAFKNRSVFTEPDQRLKKYLNTLCHQIYHNHTIRHRAIIWGTTLSEILLLNAIRRMNRSNNWIAVTALAVALIALIWKH